MHPGAIDFVVRQFTKLADDLRCPIGPDAGKRIFEGTEPVGGYMLTAEGAEAERALVVQLLEKHKWGRRFSERFLRKRLGNRHRKGKRHRHLKGKRTP